MRRHVVGAFGGVAEAGAAFGQPGEEVLQVFLHIGIGIFLDYQRGRSVADETGQQSVRDLRTAHKIQRLIGEFDKARTPGRDREGVKGLFHPAFRK